MLRAGLAVALLCAIAAPGRAQAPKSIDPGMSEAKVVERIGQPDASRPAGDFKYLFYHNDCIRQCGMDDVVILQKDSVVDAMFRSAERTYTGKSSSPRAIPAQVAARSRPGGHDAPSGEVVQAGAPKAELPIKPADEVKADTTKKADSTVKPAAEPKHVTHKAANKPQAPVANADTTRRDTINGTLHIPVKPQHHSMGTPDSTRPDSGAKRPPHER
jgi:hypothetical protein